MSVWLAGVILTFAGDVLGLGTNSASGGGGGNQTIAGSTGDWTSCGMWASQMGITDTDWTSGCDAGTAAVLAHMSSGVTTPTVNGGGSASWVAGYNYGVANE